jgi:hypothetical protein
MVHTPALGTFQIPAGLAVGLATAKDTELFAYSTDNPRELGPSPVGEV